MTTIEPIVRVGFVFLCAYFTQQINSPPAQAQQGKKIAWELFLTAMKAWLAFQIVSYRRMLTGSRTSCAHCLLDLYVADSSI